MMCPGPRRAPPRLASASREGEKEQVAARRPSGIAWAKRRIRVLRQAREFNAAKQNNNNIAPTVRPPRPARAPFMAAQVGRLAGRRLRLLGARARAPYEAPGYRRGFVFQVGPAARRLAAPGA